MNVKMIILCLLLAGIQQVAAQSYEAKQLLLDWSKLEQMKGILKDMKEGYEIVSKGYSTIRDISQGNFNLHEAFLDGLWLVSPTIRKYWKIPEIINDQLQIVKEYKSAFNHYKQSGLLNPDEIMYLGQVYNNLFSQSLKGLDDLTMLITANQLRMSDDERLSGIDKVYNDMQDKLQFLQSFNNKTSVLLLQRNKEQSEVLQMDRLYGIKK
ncbi:TerB family tellurite resistance protein [Ilyomonas limi]|uniref:TerB family tellurite resistance protein n=1 Tax=Ilyomonas limi TaxID=2575867 RepID=A0A4U3KYX9_9BACT|nr:TerB family tellurite resistance protein [Ilyomonas limi]TKK66337.1 TerB family tellurite resistance protein [Ilyomonas limi]